MCEFDSIIITRIKRTDKLNEQLKLSRRETDAMFTNVETKLMADFQRSIHISTKITESPLLRLLLE